MYLDNVKKLVLSLPEVSGWPALAGVFTRAMDHATLTWELPLAACRAVGGAPAAAVPGAASIACVQLGLILVDDMLDDDPRGEYRTFGEPAAANMAFALQAAAFRLVEEADVDGERRAAACAGLARMALVTSYGQDLDAQNLAGEEAYWRIVETKSSPCFGEAAYLGALLGGAPLAVAGELRAVGLLYGESVQVYDDLADALNKPAGPDWVQGRNNLAILYARMADHAGRDRFESLLPRAADDPAALAEAQQVLVRSGAVSFGAYHVIQRQQAARALIARLPLADPAPLLAWIDRQREPLVSLFEQVGAESPPELEAA